ncbi:MAG: methyltransferase domain-containing protein [Candidatus Hydrogenedentes bacterium]|nr:methyltransferase domain-containing protein [Candidatus Hydrogenedentota bacterium]
MRLSSEAVRLLACPCCGSRLREAEGFLACSGSACGVRFPVIDGIPVLLNESNSLFRFSDYTAGADTFYRKASRGKAKRLLTRLIPDCSLNVKAAKNYKRLANELLKQSPVPRILVLGGSVFNRGMESLLVAPFELIETDVALGARTQAIVDGHNIPFEDNCLDCVVVHAVLEHVLDPVRCVSEIHRVLKPNGLVYAETPFMQQVHAGPYDFMRFTHLGHRRLFRRFEELESGAACGPGMALAWSYQYFLMSFSTNAKVRSLLTAFAHLTAFWLTWFDRYLIDKPGCLDAASGVYFLGRKSTTELADRELIEGYRGAIGLLKPRV